MPWQPGLDGGDGAPRDFINSVRICLRKYDGFSGRAPRAEYWWFTLANVLVQLVTRVLTWLIWGSGPHLAGVAIRGVVELLLVLPGLAVGVRRLHDTDRSGWWMLLPVVSLVGTIILMVWFRTESILLLKVAPALIGTIILIVWFCGRGTRGPNRFGPENGVP